MCVDTSGTHASCQTTMSVCLRSSVSLVSLLRQVEYHAMITSRPGTSPGTRDSASCSFAQVSTVVLHGGGHPDGPSHIKTRGKVQVRTKAPAKEIRRPVRLLHCMLTIANRQSSAMSTAGPTRCRPADTHADTFQKRSSRERDGFAECSPVFFSST